MRRYPFGMRWPTAGRKVFPVLAAVIGAAALVFTVGSASAAGIVAFGFGSADYRFSATETTGWEQPGFNDAGWSLAQAPFASNVAASPGCGFPKGNTLFAPGGTGTIFVRRSFTVPDNAFGLHIVGSVDNDADFWVNGTPEGGHIHDGNCTNGGINLQVGNADLNRGAGNPDGAPDNQLIAVKVTALDAGSPSFFDMQATYGSIDFGQQPTETEMTVSISPAPTVQITDADGNPVVGTTVTVSLQTLAGTGVLSGTTTVPTDGSGVATFPDLAVSDAGTYRLVAASEGATTSSDAFLIANQVTPCTGECSASGSAQGTTMQGSTTSTTGSLAVSVVSDATPPPGACVGFVQLGAGSYVNILGVGAPFPDFTMVWQVDKALVKQAGNPSPKKFNICLGAEDLSHPDGVGTTPWVTKDGTPAVGVVDPDFPDTELFWGIVPNCKGSIKKHKPTGPCILKRQKKKGNVLVTVFKPAPWDGRVYGG